MNKDARILLVGASGGVGSSCKQLLSDYNVVTLSSTDLNLDYPEQIFDYDFSKFDLLLNCSGHSKGTFNGFLNNSWQNQYSQIKVNYISNLFLLKHYANSNVKGKYVWISSSLMNAASPFHSVYASSKVASKFAIDLIRKEAAHIDILEVNLGLTKSNFRYNNYDGTKTIEEVNQMYQQENPLQCNSVAKQILLAIEQDLTEVIIHE